jgi:hypothetical protein
MSIAKTALIGKDLQDAIMQIATPFDLTGARFRFALGEDETPSDLAPSEPVVTLWLSTPAAEQEAITMTSMSVGVIIGLAFKTLLNDPEDVSSYDNFCERHNAAEAVFDAVHLHQLLVQDGETEAQAYLVDGTLQQTIGSLSGVQEMVTTISTRFSLRYEKFTITQEVTP